MAVTGWVLQSRHRSKAWGTRCLLGVDSCDSKGQEAELAEEGIELITDLGQPRRGVPESDFYQCPTSGQNDQAFIPPPHSVSKCGRALYRERLRSAAEADLAEADS